MLQVNLSSGRRVNSSQGLRVNFNNSRKQPLSQSYINYGTKETMNRANFTMYSLN